MLQGVRVENVNILDLLPPEEGTIDQFYGRIGSGKTYMATRDILKRLNAGDVVYANWRVQWSGYDQRDSRFCSLLGVLGLKRKFYNFPKENLRYLPIDEHFLDTLECLTDCAVYLDEGHLAFDSYEMAKMNIRKRATVLHTRHFDRQIVIISQRPTAIHVTLRANVNRFFKCERVFKFGGFVVFRKIEFQDFNQFESVNEEDEAIVSSRVYFGRKKVFNSYDTKYLRGSVPASQNNLAQVFRLSWLDTVKNLFSLKKLFTSYAQKRLTVKAYSEKISLWIKEKKFFTKTNSKI